MSNHALPRAGAVLSADIAVPDHDRELRFYARVLGTGDSPLWREDLMNNVGVPVIGLGRRTAEYEGTPLQWMPHIQVADVARSAQRSAELGGSILMHQQDPQGRSLWAVLQDPNGAAFGVIPFVDAAMIPEGARNAAGPVGRIAWMDLTIPGAQATRDFYREIVGWSVQDVAMQDGEDPYVDYLMVGADAAPLAGVCHARGGNATLPPVWLLYLPVGDVEESLRRVTAEGGSVVKVVRGREGQCVYAAVRDPVGAVFALVQEPPATG